MIKSITHFLIIFFIFQQLKSQISKIYHNGYNLICDETLHILTVYCTIHVPGKVVGSGVVGTISVKINIKGNIKIFSIDIKTQKTKLATHIQV